MNYRIQRVLDKMNNMGVGQMLVTDPDSVWYLTGVRVDPGERLFALLLRADGEHVFFFNKLFAVPKTPYREVWFSDTDNCIALLAWEIERKVKPENCTLGIDKFFTASFLLPLQERCRRTRMVLASDCVDDCRAIKDDDEIKLMREASQIADRVIMKAKAFTKIGMTEKEIAEFIDGEFKKEGCSGPSFPTIVSFGANAADPHHEPDGTVLKEGDCVLYDIGCRKNNYCSDITRTYFCKSADEEYAALHDLVRKACEKAESIVRPGMRFCDIDAAARQMIRDKGYGDYFFTRLGHFIGQADHEKGDVSSANMRVAEPGMIFSIEPGIYMEGKFGVRVEDLVLVTETGCEILNKVPRAWEIIG